MPLITTALRLRALLRTPGRYETLENETIEDLFSYTGGFSSTAYKKAVYVDRVAELQREIIKIEQKDYVTSQLFDGDIIEAKNVTEKYTNKSVFQEKSICQETIHLRKHQRFQRF